MAPAKSCEKDLHSESGSGSASTWSDMRVEKSVVMGPGLLLKGNACSSVEARRSGKFSLGFDVLELELLGCQITARLRLSSTVVALCFPSILFATKFKIGIALGRGKLLFFLQIRRL